MHSGFDLARERSQKNAIALAYNGKLYDLATNIKSIATATEFEKIEIFGREDPRALEIIRHSTAHLLAHAVKELFPEVQVTIGPVIENGFYYDFACSPFTPEDLVLIEKKMHDLVKRNIKIIRKEVERDEAIKIFQSQNEKYKTQIIQSIPEGDPITLYYQDNFVDLCRGPHVPSTSSLKVFRLTKIAGAYWRGDSNNEMLQRIYGTAWSNNEQQEQYLHLLAEAEKRDHRKLAKFLQLFHIQDEAPGMIFWHPNGYALWHSIEKYMREVYQLNNYMEVKCPSIIDRSLWEKSGHWQHYKDNMFTTESEKREYAIKPMNCPGHIQIFNSSLHSYRDLPLRYGEFGSCHRNESSGSLHGLLRARGFTQDDGHIFCTPDQIEAEVISFNSLVFEVYKTFGFDQIIIKLALRPEQRIGSDDEWDRAEKALKDGLSKCSDDWSELPNEGAFYGPKIEYHIKDAIGRSWQCGTMQVDFSMPGLLGAEYVAEDNSRRTPVLLHRAVIGSFERFIGILIEHYAGALPLWLAPIQVMLLNISQAQSEFTEKFTRKLVECGIRAKSDLRNEKINYKIREHSLQKIPYLAIIGNREVESNSVALRSRGNHDLGVISSEELIKKLLDQSASRIN